MSEERIAALQQLLEQEPNDTMLLFGLANDYHTLGQFAEAITYFERALTVDPEYAAVYVRLAWAYEQNNQIDLARKTLERGQGAIERSGDRNLMAESADLWEQLQDA
jgi:Flp pilus assembly protein TadD